MQIRGWEYADKGVILVGSTHGLQKTPADSLYQRLSDYLKEVGISSLELNFRHPKELAESVIDILVGIMFLKSENTKIFGLIGYSLGGAAAVQAAFNEKNVRTLVS